MTRRRMSHAASTLGARVRTVVIAWAALAILFVASPVNAQVPAAAPAAAAATTDAKKADAKTDKSAVDKKDAEKKPAAAGADDSAPKAKEGDVLSFRESEVAAEMTELEERMFRLSEAIRQLEPENSSRLMLGLKFAREELILHQMKETQKLLDELSLGEASAEQKHLVTKLQRLHDLLLSTDLDLQMRLERLRQLREIIRRLDKVIQEEEREQRLTKDVASIEKQVEGLRKRRISLDQLIKRQTAHVRRWRSSPAACRRPISPPPQTSQLTRPLKSPTTPRLPTPGVLRIRDLTTRARAAEAPVKVGAGESGAGESGAGESGNAGKLTDEQAQAIAKLAEGQQATQADTKKFSEAEAKRGDKLKHVDQAHEEMGQAGKSLVDKSAAAALPHQQSALEALKRRARRDDEGPDGQGGAAFGRKVRRLPERSNGQPPVDRRRHRFRAQTWRHRRRCAGQSAVVHGQHVVGRNGPWQTPARTGQQRPDVRGRIAPQGPQAIGGRNGQAARPASRRSQAPRAGRSDDDAGEADRRARVDLGAGRASDQRRAASLVVDRGAFQFRRPHHHGGR